MSTNDLFEDLRTYKVCCPNCKTSFPLSSWGFVQTYWYERPHGCIEGDNWWPNVNIMLCLLICPNNCHQSGNNLAVRIMDLPIQQQEKNWVFGFIQQATELCESKLKQIFEGHYSQYGIGKEIENSEERKERLEDTLDF